MNCWRLYLKAQKSNTLGNICIENTLDKNVKQSVQQQGAVNYAREKFLNYQNKDVKKTAALKRVKKQKTKLKTYELLHGE